MIETNTSTSSDALEAKLMRAAMTLAEARATELRQSASQQDTAWYDARVLWPMQGKV